MRFSDYLTMLPDADQTALTNDLTLGYGRLGLAARLHREAVHTATMLGTLAAAYASLRAALLVLDPDAAPESPPAPAVAVDALPPDWHALVVDGQQEIICALLTMAVEMARDAVAATLADADVAVVRRLVGDALHMLRNVREDTLGTA